MVARRKSSSARGDSAKRNKKSSSSLSEVSSSSQLRHRAVPTGGSLASVASLFSSTCSALFLLLCFCCCCCCGRPASTTATASVCSARRPGLRQRQHYDRPRCTHLLPSLGSTRRSSIGISCANSGSARDTSTAFVSSGISTAAPTIAQATVGAALSTSRRILGLSASLSSLRGVGGGTSIFLGDSAWKSERNADDVGGNGDGRGRMWMKAKKKNKRKRAGGDGDSDADGTAPAPQRVTKDAPVSVRTQIRYAKMKKSQEKAHVSSAKKIPNTYRRVKSMDYQEIVEPEDLSKVYMPKISPAMMVDGYNIIFHWGKCAVLADNGNLEEARSVLVNELDTLAAMRRWKVTVVFDAHKRRGGGQRMYKTPNKIEIVYTDNGETADMYVERETMILKDSGCPNVMVATGDKLMQSLVEGAGAEVYSPDRIIEEISTCHYEARQYADSYVKKKQKMFEADEMKQFLGTKKYMDIPTRKPSGRSGRGGRGGRGGGGRGRDEPYFDIEEDIFGSSSRSNNRW